MTDMKTSEIVISQINKRVDNMENRVCKRVEVIEEKLDSMTSTLSQNSLILAEHMRRTALNEKAIEDFRLIHMKSMDEFKAFQNKLLGGFAIVAFLSPFLLFIIQKVSQ
jgi:hypothetical protein